MSNGNAPVCNVQISNQPGNPQSPKIQVIPHNANLRQVIQIINNNFQTILKGNFVEDKARRQTTTVRIFDPDDKSIYVDVQQITSLSFVNPQTGQTISWRQ